MGKRSNREAEVVGASVRAQHALTLASHGLPPTTVRTITAAARSVSTASTGASAPAPTTRTPSTPASLPRNPATLSFALEFTDISFLNTSIRQLISSQDVPDHSRAVISSAASAIKGLYRSSTTALRQGLEALPNVTNETVRTNLLRLVALLRIFHSSNRHKMASRRRVRRLSRPAPAADDGLFGRPSAGHGRRPGASGSVIGDVLRREGAVHPKRLRLVLGPQQGS